MEYRIVIGGNNLSLRYALIGCGRISPNHIAAAIENDLQIIALCDVATEKMDEVITVFNLKNVARKYTDYKEMLEKRGPN